MMNNYQIIIEYDGTKFVGWKKQKNGISVQEILEKKIKKVLKEKVILIGAGRTDAGVHALAQSANFFTKKKIYGIQFHPELSRNLGSNFFKNIYESKTRC